MNFLGDPLKKHTPQEGALSLQGHHFGGPLLRPNSADARQVHGKDHLGLWTTLATWTRTQRRENQEASKVRIRSLFQMPGGRGIAGPVFGHTHEALRRDEGLGEMRVFRGACRFGESMTGIGGGGGGARL